MTEEPSGILRLSNELLKEILDHLARDPEKFTSVDNRAYLSIESFKRPSPPDPPRIWFDGKNGFREDPRSDIDRFREVCKRFSEIGAAHKFSRVIVRFSEPGFKRLDKLSSFPQLAKHTRTFTYIIRSFYVEDAVGRDDLPQLFRTADSSKLKVTEHFHRLEEQRRLIGTNEDLHSLTRAMKAFTTLQHVKVLRVQDEAERDLDQFIKRHVNSSDPSVILGWKPACARAVQTLGAAMLEAGSPVNRFSGPQICPEATLSLKEAPTTLISALASKLTCLEIHFDAKGYVNAEMRELSDVFRTLFTAAKNMEAVHLGFPSRLPLDLHLEDIFHNVYWGRLRAFGIQAWRLDSEEVMNFARRHRRTLRGLRLRDVLLKEGSMWRDILCMLRDEMECLEWVSLRRIDYSNSFDDKWATSANISEIRSFSDSDSDDDDMFDTYEGPAHIADDDEDDSSIGAESDGLSSHNGDVGPRANQIELTPDNTVSAPLPLPHSANQWEVLNTISAEDLGDIGITVEYRQRKLWEAWVISKSKINRSRQI
ncbi:hypothetical protein FQN57_007039 [Myotisia sp. PD_48]|nr:hypothetical protein FQN57_007039 [Myotisia sp. PD_48]